MVFRGCVKRGAILLKLKQEKRYVQKRIEGIEGAISVHQSAIDFDNPCEEGLKYRQGAIEDLLVDLEAFRHYLNYLNTKGAENRAESGRFNWYI